MTKSVLMKPKNELLCASTYQFTPLYATFITTYNPLIFYGFALL